MSLVVFLYLSLTSKLDILTSFIFFYAIKTGCLFFMQCQHFIERHPTFSNVLECTADLGFRPWLNNELHAGRFPLCCLSFACKSRQGRKKKICSSRNKSFFCENLSDDHHFQYLQWSPCGPDRHSTVRLITADFESKWFKRQIVMLFFGFFCPSVVLNARLSVIWCSAGIQNCGSQAWEL